MDLPINTPRLLYELAKHGLQPPYVAGVDSATATVEALANYLHGEDVNAGGPAPSLSSGAMQLLNKLPDSISDSLFVASGWLDATEPDHVDRVQSKTMTEWVTSIYPKRQYPGALIGSTNGAAMHLGAALDMPWLPQTLMVAVRRSDVHIDDPQADMEWGREPARRILENNPDLKVYQMHDPNQDRQMLQELAYFRLKRTTLGDNYIEFLEKTLAPGATLFVVECTYDWPTTAVADRHTFQHGGTGGATHKEYFEGGERVHDFLKRHHSPFERWAPPEPDAHRPEAEWGFDLELMQDIERLAARRGYKIRRIIFHDPQDLSPLVADFYRTSYWHRGLPGDRLVIESFVYLQPWWIQRTGAVPYWSVFPVDPSTDQLQEYLDQIETPYEEMYLNLFSNGIQSIGQASIERWYELLRYARLHGTTLGVDETSYPHDYASAVRYYTALKKLDREIPLLTPLSLEQLDTFLDQHGHRYRVEWRDHPVEKQPDTSL
jgi:hypothetical protein